MENRRVGSCLFIAMLAAGCDTETTSDPFPDDVTERSVEGADITTQSLVVELRDRYKDIGDAHADGYGDVPPCLEGLGFHVVDFPRFLDDEIDLQHPETLRYAPNEEGELKLVAIEYSRPAPFGVPEPLFGQEFEGPADTGVPGLPPIYFLTISVRHNPDGMLSTFNPKVACRGTGVALGFAPCAYDPAIACLVPSTCEEIGATACIEWEQSQQ